MLFFLVSAFQFVLMIPAYQIEQCAKEKGIVYANQFSPQKQKVVEQQFIRNYLDSISNKIVFTIPFINNCVQLISRKSLILLLSFFS